MNLLYIFNLLSLSLGLHSHYLLFKLVLAWVGGNHTVNHLVALIGA